MVTRKKLGKTKEQKAREERKDEIPGLGSRKEHYGWQSRVRPSEPELEPILKEEWNKLRHISWELHLTSAEPKCKLQIGNDDYDGSEDLHIDTYEDVIS